MENTKNNTFLTVMAIIMIVGGALSIILSIISLAGLGMLAAVGMPIGIVIVAGIIAIGSSVLELVAGIIGVKGAKNPAKAKTALTLGIIILVLSLVSIILTIVSSGVNVVSIITGLVVPVLFVIAAAQAKNA